MQKLLIILTIHVGLLISMVGCGKENRMIFHKNIIRLTQENNNFRQVLATASHSQIVLMSLRAGEDIGTEVHKDVDQTLVFVEGTGIARISGKEYTISSGDIFLIPAGTQHNFTNTGKKDLKLFTVYAPAEFEKPVSQKVKPKNNP